MSIQHLRLLFLVLPVLFLSCSKPNDNPSPIATDSLFSWKVVGNIPSPRGVSDIWFTSPSKGFAAVTDRNLYRTVDSGKTWSIIPNTKDSSAGGMFYFFFVDDKYGFVGGASQLQITKDGGLTWKLVQLPTGSAQNIFFTSRSTGYYSDDDHGIFKTTDTGNTWTLNHSATTSHAIYFSDPDIGYILSLDGTLSKTTNGALSWQPVKQNIFHNTQEIEHPYNTLQFLDNLTGYFGCSSGVLKTTDGGQSWKNVYTTISRGAIIKFFTPAAGYYREGSTIHNTTDGGQSWTTSCKLPGQEFFFGMYFIDSTTGWACTSKGNILRKTSQ